MKNLILVIFVTILLIGCKKKSVECSYLYTDSNTGLAYRGTDVICEKCSKNNARKRLTSWKILMGIQTWIVRKRNNHFWFK